MVSKLEEKLNNAVMEFGNKAIKEIPTKKNYKISTSGPSSLVLVTQKSIKNSLKILFASKNTLLIDDILSHFQYLEKLVPFCSSPGSFRAAWAMRSNTLNKHAADRLVNEGAQLIPVNKVSPIFGIKDQQGPVLGINGRLVTGVRHSIGNYKDKLDDLGRFTYQPPRKPSGMLRYRWCEFFSTKIAIPFVMIAIIWLWYELAEGYRIPVFVIAPAKITHGRKNIKHLGRSLNKPLNLQIVKRNDVFKSLNQLYSLHENITNIKMRKELDVQLADEWAYEEINNARKGKEIKNWYKEKRKKCPGSKCGHVKFEELPDSEITFGHIIPQDWAKTFLHHLPTIHHPDNIYLTCRSCNSSLGNNFPNKQNISQEDIEKAGTIGDWLRKVKK